MTTGAGAVFVGTGGGALEAFAAASGKRLWQTTFGLSVGTAAALVGDQAFAGLSDGTVAAFSARGVSLAPNDVLPGASVRVAGAGFAPNEQVMVRWNGTSGAVLGQAKADAFGAFAAISVTTPNVANGAYEMAATGAGGTVCTGTMTLGPQLIVRGLGAGPVSDGLPAGVHPTQAATVTGQGFAPGSRVTVEWVAVTTTLLASVVASSGGGIVATVTVPAAVSGYDVLQANASAGAGAGTWVRVVAVARTAPRRGPLGTAFTVTGDGFAANEPVTIYWGPVKYQGQRIVGQAIATTTADAMGTLAPVTATVPSDAKVGATVVTAWGMVSFISARAPFVVTSAAPSHMT